MIIHHLFNAHKKKSIIRFSFYVEKICINNYDLTYRQFFNILFIYNKIFSLCIGKKIYIFLERETISPIECVLPVCSPSVSFARREDANREALLTMCSSNLAREREKRIETFN